MANTYSVELAPTQTVPAGRTSSLAGYDARVRCYRATVNLASQAIGDTVTLANVPAGYVFAGGELVTNTSLGSATIAVGVSGTPAYFKAAGTQTVTDAPAFFGTTAAYAEVSPAARTVIATVAGAALPASGTLVFNLCFIAP